MGKITRNTITFYLPTDSIGVQSVGEFGTENAGGFVTKKEVKLYLNPESLQISESKIIQNSNTKGGFLVQYWGENLSTMSASGSTGSGGVEALNILREIYRHEIAEFNNVILKRAQLIKDKTNDAILQSANPNGNNLLTGALDFATGGLYSQITNGLDTLGEMFTGNFVPPEEKERRSFSRTPTLASLATGVEMHYQGEIYRGYFSQFNSTEAVSSLGIFTYTFSFTILDRVGQRKNFMPWHRNPRDEDGNPKKASIPIEGQRLDELSHSSDYEDRTSPLANIGDVGLGLGDVSTNVLQNQTGIDEEGFKPVSRRNVISGKG
jgi:hypothetical protein